MKKNDEGFTLVELLIVIVILGILATIVVFAVRGVTDQGQENSCEATSETYQTAIEAWYAQGAANRVDGGLADHPSGDDLEQSNLIRDYDGSAMEVVEAGPVSFVRSTAGGDCIPFLTGTY